MIDLLLKVIFYICKAKNVTYVILASNSLRFTRHKRFVTTYLNLTLIDHKANQSRGHMIDQIRYNLPNKST